MLRGEGLLLCCEARGTERHTEGGSRGRTETPPGRARGTKGIAWLR